MLFPVSVYKEGLCVYVTTEDNDIVIKNAFLQIKYLLCENSFLSI